MSLLSEEEEEEQEEEEEEEFVAFRGHANPEISFDALEFTEKQLDSFNRVRRKSLAGYFTSNLAAFKSVKKKSQFFHHSPIERGK